MLKAKNDTRGFTLAELLMSIAIIFILVLIALPTVVSTQKNMHMLELNNAANQVATAVQTQMTADKVSGTWLEKIDAVPNAKAQKATGLVAADIKNEANIYYLNADQVRANNLLPPAGIDSSVRESDYVLEYDATTAVVCGVFYSDNKGGWLSSGKATGTAAQTYYQASQSPNKRDEAKRRDADPMIGYFGGRAAGATEGIALAKPVIWVDSEGQLCVQDANLRKKTAPYDAAALQLTLTAPNGKPTFTLMGLQQSATTYTIKTNTATTETFTNADTNKIFQLVSAADDVSNNKDIYQIDLNQLKKAMEAASKNDDLKSALAAFNIGDLMRVEASVTVGVPCVPATALANTPWPGPVAQLRVLVTNPSIDGEIAKDPAKDKGYTTPQVAIEGKVPAAVPLTKDKEEIKFGQVVNKDAESARQVYTGAKMNLQTAVEATPDGKATANAQAGAYTNANKTKHSYQIYEIWVGNTLAGSYGPEGTWVWNSDPALATLSECFTFAAGTQISAPLTAVFISAPKLNAISSLRNEVGGYDVYVRTAPSLRDAQDYFDQNNSFRAAICNGNVTARGVDGQSTQAQAAFKEEFGCTSSVALWTVTRKKLESSVSGFDWKDLYLYYAPTPLRPAAKPQAKGQHNDLTCAVLWRYASTNPSAGQANPKDFARKDNQAPAFAQNATSVPQLQGQEVSRAQIVAPQNFMNEKPLDFLIPLDNPNMDPPNYPATDQLYFRYMKYYEKNDGGSMIIQQQQWVPLFARDLKSNEPKKGTTFARPLKKDEFTFWNVAQDGSGASFKAGTSIAEQSRSLPLGAVSLYAQYATVGLLYVEFDGPFNPLISGVPQGSVTGYYGSLDGKTIVKNGSDPALLPTNNKLSSWGYCLATKPGQGAPVCPRGYQAPDKLGPYTLQGSNYDLYPLKPEPTSTSADGSTQVLQFAPAGVSLEAGPTYTYTVNLNFAAAVEVASNKGDAQRWGRDPEKGGLPWQVRHADQLIMNLKSTEAKTVYGTSSTTFFNQTHDIDWEMSSTPHARGGSLEKAFGGTYNGQGFKISNFITGAVSYIDPATKQPTRGFGLFPQAEGATLTDINLVDIQRFDVEHGAVSSSDAFGLLVDNAINCKITRCWAKGNPNEEKNRFVISATNNKVAIGGLVGRSVSTNGDNAASITGGGVSGAEFIFEPVWWSFASESLSFGGIVGESKNCSLFYNWEGSADTHSPPVVVGPLVLNLERAVQNGVNLPAPKSIAIGGLVGVLQADRKTSVATRPRTDASPLSINKMLLIVPDNKQNWPQDLARYSFGGLVGQRIGGSNARISERYWDPGPDPDLTSGAFAFPRTASLDAVKKDPTLQNINAITFNVAKNQGPKPLSVVTKISGSD